MPDIYAMEGFIWGTDILPISGAFLIVGTLMSAVKHDWRWLLLAAILGVFLWLGQILRWAIYDRWLTKALKTG